MMKICIGIWIIFMIYAAGLIAIRLNMMVTNPADWPYSTFHRYVKQSLYPANWGENITFDLILSFGE